MFAAPEIILKFKDNEKLLYKNIMEFYKIVSEEQYTFLKENIKSKKDISEFCKSLIEDGAYIHQPPFYNNITVDKMLELHCVLDLYFLYFRLL